MQLVSGKIREKTIKITKNLGVITMNYIGSKKKLLPFLDKCIYEITQNDTFVLMDLFAGTGAVGQHFKQKGHAIIANDLQYYSYVLNKNYIENSQVLHFEGLFSEISELQSMEKAQRAGYVCHYLNQIEGKEGFIYQNYCSGGTANQDYQRQYFSDENGKKVDAIRQKIATWKENKLIKASEYYFLLASLLEGIDKVANTASVYGAFLKHLKKSAQKTFEMKPAYFEYSQQKQQVFNQNIEDIIQKVQGEVLYLDPPYNHRQYAPNYHLLETIAKYDAPILKGKTGLRDYSQQISKFAQKKAVVAAFEHLIQHTKAKFVFLSYNNEGLLKPEEIKKIMCQRGEYGVFEQTYARFKADKDENRSHKADSVNEYLHYLTIKDSPK